MMIWKSRSALALPEPSTYCDSALAAIGMTARAAVASKVLVSKRMVDVLRLKKRRISVGRGLAHDLARGVPGRYPCRDLVQNTVPKRSGRLRLSKDRKSVVEGRGMAVSVDKGWPGKNKKK